MLLNSLFVHLAGLAIGAGIGYGFGVLQRAAAVRNALRQERRGSTTSGWLLMPGSFGRVTLLLIALALVQVLCPILFVDVARWSVSAGLVVAYGCTLFRDLRSRQAEASR